MFSRTATNLVLDSTIIMSSSMPSSSFVAMVVASVSMLVLLFACQTVSASVLPCGTDPDSPSLTVMCTNMACTSSNNLIPSPHPRIPPQVSNPTLNYLRVRTCNADWREGAYCKANARHFIDCPYWVPPMEDVLLTVDKNVTYFIVEVHLHPHATTVCSPFARPLTPSPCHPLWVSVLWCQ